MGFLLPEYDFEIKYVVVKSNIVADNLSRFDEEKNNKRMVKSGLNSLKVEDGICSLLEVRESQDRIIEKDKKI